MGSGEKRHLCLAVIILLLGINFIIITDTGIVQGNTLPPFMGWISIYQDSEKAYVAPGQDGIVKFNGSISAMYHGGYHPVDTVLVEVRAEAGGWNVSDIPPVILNRTKRICDFEFTVQVPPGTPVWEERNVNVTGTWRPLETNRTESLRGDSALIEINSYYLLDVVDPDRLKVDAGSSVIAEFIVHNEGNSDDRIALSVDNLGQLEKRGWKIDLYQHKLILPYQGTRNFSISIKVPSDERSGIHRINITILSLLDEVGIDITPEYEGVLEIEVDNNLWNRIGSETRIALIFGAALIIMISVLISIFIRRRKGKD